MKTKTTLAVLLCCLALSQAALYSLNGTQARAGNGTGSLATGMIIGDYDDSTNLLTWSISWTAEDLINGCGVKAPCTFTPHPLAPTVRWKSALESPATRPPAAPPSEKSRKRRAFPG